jgi:VWFA-related protein
MRKSPLALFAWLLLAAYPFAAFSQTSSQGAANAQTPVVIRSTTRFVQVNVLVHDRKGMPVEGLKKEDFTILDQGQEQEVAVFSAIAASPHGPASTPALPANVFTNRMEQSDGPPGSVTIILFDALNTEVQDQFRARQQIVKFLRQLRPQDHVAIYVLTTKITVLNDFTQDASSLLRAIQQFSGEFSAFLDASNPRPSDQSIFAVRSPEMDVTESRLRDFLNAADGTIRDFANINRAETTTSAIEAIANHVARIPGRKSLVWVSASFPISIGFGGDSLSPPGREQRMFTEEIEHATRALNQANMAIYPVDARGLMVSPRYSAVNAQFSPRFPGRALGPDQGNFDTMIVLADRTGGKAAYNTNDIEGAVQRALADGQFSYTLGFYPKHGKWDGKFHELKVHVKEKGLNLRYRKGYFASPDPPNGDTEKQAALDAALASPVEWTNLDLTATLKGFEAASRSLQIQVGFDIHELLLGPKDGRWNGKLYVFFDQLGAGDKLITSEKETFGLNLKEETYDTLQKIGLRFSGIVVLSPDVVNLRVIAQDTSSGSIGTVKIPIKNFLAMRSASAPGQPLSQKP